MDSRPFAEQDFLNIYFRGRILPLPSVFNVTWPQVLRVGLKCAASKQRQLSVPLNAVACLVSLILTSGTMDSSDCYVRTSDAPAWFRFLGWFRGQVCGATSCLHRHGPMLSYDLRKAHSIGSGVATANTNRHCNLIDSQKCMPLHADACSP